MNDLIDAKGSFLSFKLFEMRYGILKVQFLQIFSSNLCYPERLTEKKPRSLPKDPKEPNTNFLSGGILFQLSSVLTIDPLKLRSKDYYWLFLDKRKSQATGPMKWNHDFAPMSLALNQIVNRVKLIYKENQFYFKLIHHIFATKKELTLYGITDNNRSLTIGC